jgi:hypothetical protein
VAQSGTPHQCYSGDAVAMLEQLDYYGVKTHTPFSNKTVFTFQMSDHLPPWVEVPANGNTREQEVCPPALAGVFGRRRRAARNRVAAVAQE